MFMRYLIQAMTYYHSLLCVGYSSACTSEEIPHYSGSFLCTESLVITVVDVGIGAHDGCSSEKKPLCHYWVNSSLLIEAQRQCNNKPDCFDNVSDVASIQTSNLSAEKMYSPVAIMCTITCM